MSDNDQCSGGKENEREIGIEKEALWFRVILECLSSEILE